MNIVADEQIPFVNTYFQNHGSIFLKPGRAICANDVIDADILLVRSVTKVNAELLASSKVKWVGSVTAGMDHLDEKFLQRNGIPYSVASGFNAPPVADYVVSAIAACQNRGLLLGDKLKAAVIGVGQVGSRVATNLRILGFEVLLCDPLRQEAETDFSGVALADIEDMDLISLHVPLTHQTAHATYHLITDEFLRRQRQGCVIINASRGAVINTEMIIRHQGRINWCLDVWEGEPSINRQALLSTQLATPHIAGYSAQSRYRGIALIHQQGVQLCIISEEKERRHVTFPKAVYRLLEGITSWRDVLRYSFDFERYVVNVKQRLLAAHKEQIGDCFDALRRTFPERHEFAYTEVHGGNLPIKDKYILQKLGFTLF